MVTRLLTRSSSRFLAKVGSRQLASLSTAKIPNQDESSSYCYQLSALLAAGVVTATNLYEHRQKNNSRPKCCGIAGVVGFNNPQHDARCVSRLF